MCVCGANDVDGWLVLVGPINMYDFHIWLLVFTHLNALYGIIKSEILDVVYMGDMCVNGICKRLSDMVV